MRGGNVILKTEIFHVNGVGCADLVLHTHEGQTQALSPPTERRAQRYSDAQERAGSPAGCTPVVCEQRQVRQPHLASMTFVRHTSFATCV